MQIHQTSRLSVPSHRVEWLKLPNRNAIMLSIAYLSVPSHRVEWLKPLPIPDSEMTFGTFSTLTSGRMVETLTELNQDSAEEANFQYPHIGSNG